MGQRPNALLAGWLDRLGMALELTPGARVEVSCPSWVTLGVPFDEPTAALQKCYDEHFLPVWGYEVKLYNTKTADPSDWQLVYFDDADTVGALGYHDLTHNGQPISKVFVKTTTVGHRNEYRKPGGLRIKRRTRR